MQLVGAVKSLTRSAEELHACEKVEDLPKNLEKSIEDNMSLLEATMKLGEK